MSLTLEMFEETLLYFYMPDEKHVEDGLRREDDLGFRFRRNKNPMPYFKFFKHPKRILRLLEAEGLLDA